MLAEIGTDSLIRLSKPIVSKLRKSHNSLVTRIDPTILKRYALHEDNCEFVQYATLTPDNQLAIILILQRRDTGLLDPQGSGLQSDLND